MEFKELKSKSESELHHLLADFRNKIRELRFKDASKQLKNVREIRKAKGTVAQVLTLLHKKDKQVK
jgi:ribosomal protein L29